MQRTHREAVLSPDWEKVKLLLVEPAIWKFYTEKKHDLRPVYEQLHAALESLGVEYHVLTAADRPVDIWSRDWGFVENSYFIFKPSYARNLYSQKAIAKARNHLNQHLGITFRSIPIVLDGGNFVHNGRIAI